jgi:DNA-binding SARP family transcriptional activator
MSGRRVKLDFLLLGPLEVRENGQAFPLGGPRQRAVLALLLLHPNRPVPADRILEELWRDPGAKNALEAAISRLRRSPLRGRLETQPSGYLFRVDPGEIDVVRFEHGLAEAREALAAGDAGYASQTLRNALALFRGEPLADLRYEPFAQSEIARLEELRLQALEERIEADLALGRHGELIGELELLAGAQPLRERLTAQLMLALYGSGRQAEALDVYRATREHLAEELGLEPGPALRELEAAILRQDASLSAQSHRFGERATPTERVREVRKLVTVVLAGLSDAAGLAERLDAEALRMVLARYFALAEKVVTRHGGTLERHIGDTVMAVFGVPELHEDDALRAVRAATELRDGFDTSTDELGRELGVRLGLHVGVRTGEVIAGDPAAAEAFVTGEPVVSAAFLLETAGPREILVDETTRRLVATAVRVAPVKPTEGETVAAWRVIGPAADGPSARSLDVPLVGREADLERLETLLRRAVLERAPRLVTLLGAAGIGKSRLAQELVAGVGADVRVLEGRCLTYGEGITFWALRELVLQLTGQADVQRGLLEVLAEADEADWIAERVLGAIGLGETIAPVEEVFAATRRLLESLAQRQPLLLVFEDVHWAEPAFLDLIEHVVDFAEDVPMLVICLARPELLEDRPEWGTRASHATVVEIDPLTDDDAERLLDSLGAVEDRTTIRLAAEGNPLFLEQIVAWLAESRLIEGELPLPPTIQAILASRLERLGPGERALLDCAAVIGRDLWEDAVLELVPAGARPAVPRHLEALVSKQFLRPARTPVRGERAFRFRHILIQAAAYRAVPKETRARLHERFADWLEQHYQQRLSEVEEIVGYHLEHAFTYRKSLGTLDSTPSMLGGRAGARLAAAGFRAWGRADIAASVNLLGRAASLLPPTSAERADVLCDLAVAFVESGTFDRAESTLAEALRTARAAGDRRTELYAILAGAELRKATDPDFTMQDLIQIARAAIHDFEELQDELGLARAWGYLADAHAPRGEVTESERALERQIDHARRVVPQERAPIWITDYAWRAADGPTSIEEGIRRCEKVRELVAGTRAAEASVDGAQSQLEAMRGNFEEARALIEHRRNVLRELGLRLGLAVACQSVSWIELLAGDDRAAEAEARQGCDALQRMGETGFLPGAFALLAESLYRQSHVDEAFRATQESERTAAVDDLDAQIRWRGTRAKVLAHRGEFDEAERLARDALAFAERTEWLNWRGDAFMDLAEVLRRAGRRSEASRAVSRALELYQRKGNIVSAERSRALLMEPAKGRLSPAPSR